MLDEIRKKLLEGEITEEELDSLEAMQREKIIAEAFAEALGATINIDNENRFPAGIALSPEELANFRYADILLPPRYALAVNGVYQAVVEQKTKKVRIEVKKLTATPFLIAAKDPAVGQVLLVVRVGAGDWREEWISGAKLNASTLAARLIYPEIGVKENMLVTYARACAVVAPIEMAKTSVAEAAVEILLKFFPDRGLGATFPIFRAFSMLREFAAEAGVDPLKVREWYEKQGLIAAGAGKVERPQNPETGKKDKPMRMLVFTERVREFLSKLDPDKGAKGIEGKIYRIEVMTGPEAGQKQLIALPDAQVVPLGAKKPTPLSALAAVLKGKHWPGEILEVKASVPYRIKILAIDPILPQQTQQKNPIDQKSETQAV